MMKMIKGRIQMKIWPDGLNCQGEPNSNKKLPNLASSALQTTLPGMGQPFLPDRQCQPRCRFDCQVLEGEETFKDVL